MLFVTGFSKLGLKLQEIPMMFVALVVVACAVVLCLALAASSSPVYGFNAKTELSSKFSSLESPRAGGTESPREPRPVVSAAGMQ